MSEKKPNFENFDGSQRQPRAIQKEALNWIADNWSSPVIIANLPTGVGKSAILKAIQVSNPNSYGIVPSNILLDQYTETYPSLNYLKGIERYTCIDDSDYTCQDRKNLKIPPCRGCTYKSCRSRAFVEPTVFNPISYYYFSVGKTFQTPEILIIDEAHQLIDTLMLLVDFSFKKSKYSYPNMETETQLIEWLKALAVKASELLKQSRRNGVREKVIEYSRFYDRLEFLIQSIEYEPANFAFYEQEMITRGKKEQYLCVKPIKPPKWLLNKLFSGVKNVILLSATILIDDIWKFGFTDYVYKDFPSPIPKENRQIQYQPAPFDMNYATDPTKVANWVKGILKQHPGKNSLVHVSYTWAEKLKPFFPEAMFNTPETKDQVLKEYKEKGGLWIAAGCSEGIDLPGDLCRLVIIPMIILGNPTDAITKKQLMLPGGRLAYELKAIKTVIQGVGRGVRSENDHAVSVIGDNKFPTLILKNKKHLPISLVEAIKWGPK